MFFSSKRGNNNYNIYLSRYNGGVCSIETQLTTTGAADQNPTAVQDSSGKIWVAWTRSEVGDIKLKFADTNGNGLWDPGESIVYDSNGNNLYDIAEPVIVGTAPAIGTGL